MPNQVSNGYQGGNSIGMVGGDFDQFILCYNDTTATLAEGTPVVVLMSNSATAGKFPQITAPQTNAVASSRIGVVSNYLRGGTSGILDDSWGYVQVRGYCEKILTLGSVTADHALKTTHNTAGATDESATAVSALTFAIAKSACTGAGNVSGVLLGKFCTV